VVVVTILIYIVVGIEIFQKRKMLRQFSHPKPLGSNGVPFVSKTTKVEVTSEPAAAHHGTRDPWELASIGPKASPAPSFVEYSITIESGARGSHIGRPLGGFDTHSAAWGYARIAFIFFIALF